MTSNYRIGTGISDVTDDRKGLQMQGFADKNQKTTGVESRLFSRAFIVEDQRAGKRVIIVSADIWAGTSVVKQEVVKRLQEKFGTLYTSDNVLISGTHTHSAPGGYTGYKLYDLTGGGFDDTTYKLIVAGMVASIVKAHNNLAPGNIYVNKGEIPDCGRNRSQPAYLNNPYYVRDRYASDTDKEMLLLKFTKLDNSWTERPVGVITWFGIHPTDRGQKNTLVCGDNKGYASAIFETSMHMDPSAPETFVAAFANAIAGDVSGNVEFGKIPNGTDDKLHMQGHGYLQYEKAKQLFDSASEALSGSIDFRHTSVDMSCVKIDDPPWESELGQRH
jgi:neutral ceramidase